MRKLFFVLLFVAMGCAREEQLAPVAAKEPTPLPRLAMNVPAGNPMTPVKASLGRTLFFDPRLSGDRTTSCSGCHDPKYGWTVGAARPVGAYAIAQNRACPSLVNVGHGQQFYWEGSAKTLEQAVEGVWRFVLVPKGEGRPTVDDIAKRVNEDPQLRAQFLAAFGAEATPERIIQALATFLRTLVPSDRTPWVRFIHGETNALSDRARRGHALFNGKARCSTCHSGVLLTDRKTHDVGSGVLTGDTGPMKTPTLLNVARSAPYFHDHTIDNLEAAVDLMLGGGWSGNKAPELRKVDLTSEERADLLAFLRELDADV